MARTFIESAYCSWAVHAERSARRQTVRATCRCAAAGVPPLRMKDLSVESWPL